MFDKLENVAEIIPKLREVAELVGPEERDLLIQSSYLLEEYMLVLLNDRQLRRVDL